MKLHNILYLLIALLTAFACERTNQDMVAFQNTYSSIKKEYAPDKRVVLFDIEPTLKNNELLLTGETTSKKGIAILLDSLKQQNIPFTNNIRVLPDSAVGNTTHALGRNSVINIRSAPKHSSELGTQGLLGMELKVLDKKGDWYRVQTPDQYISWVDKGGIALLTPEELENWQQRDKLIYTRNTGFVYEEKDETSTVVSDIVFGGMLSLIKEHKAFYEVAYPDQRMGYLKKSEAVLYTDWLKNNNSNAASIEMAAKSMLGVPYLWGGTSTKGNDCSGFTKTVYLMNGLVIPRDASQQIHAGTIVDETLTFKNLKKGDLLFFGTPGTEGKKERVTHVGIWLGNEKGEFIHSSGNVHLSSINEDQKHFDAFNKNRYLGSRRYLDTRDSNIISLKESLQ